MKVLVLVKVNSTMVPMIRMSEVYYIAAEAIYDTDKELVPRHILKL